MLVFAPIYSLTLLNLKAFPITLTELKLMAAAASIGLSKIPKNGKSNPPAIGIPIVL
jgi:hypothetical protein